MERRLITKGTSITRAKDKPQYETKGEAPRLKRRNTTTAKGYPTLRSVAGCRAWLPGLRGAFAARAASGASCRGDGPHSRRWAGA